MDLYKKPHTSKTTRTWEKKMKAIKIMAAVLMFLILVFFGLYLKPRQEKIEEKKETTMTVATDKKLFLTQENGEVVNIAPTAKNGVSIFQMQVSWRILNHKFVGDDDFHRLTVNENDFMDIVEILRTRGEVVGSCGEACEVYIF